MRDAEGPGSSIGCAFFDIEVPPRSRAVATPWTPRSSYVGAGTFSTVIESLQASQPLEGAP